MANVTFSGPLFRKDPKAVIARTMHVEAVAKVKDRWLRKGRRIGRKNNELLSTESDLNLKVTTTLHHPRRTGAAWQRAQIAAARSMLPRVLNKTGKRIQTELNGF